MTKQYFYQFSQGSYSDYGVGGLFVCDHAITNDEWDAAYKVYSDECERLAKLIPTEPNSNHRRVFDCDEMRAYRAYRDLSVEESFQQLHGMVALECTEFWRDC